MSKRRVVVTGLGAVTPVGNNVQAFWESVKTGKIGIGEITRFDTADFKVKLAAEVKDFNAKDYMDFKSAKRMELFSQYAVAAAKEAMADAGIEMGKEDPFRVGVIVGSGIGSLQAMESADQRLIQRGPPRMPKRVSASDFMILSKALCRSRWRRALIRKHWRRRSMQWNLRKEKPITECSQRD